METHHLDPSMVEIHGRLEDDDSPFICVLVQHSVYCTCKLNKPPEDKEFDMFSKKIYDSESFTVFVRDDQFDPIRVESRCRLISIFVDKKFIGDSDQIVTGASISWSSPGSQSIDDARRFQRVLEEAIALADRIERDVAPRIDRGDSFDSIKEITL